MSTLIYEHWEKIKNIYILIKTKVKNTINFKKSEESEENTDEAKEVGSEAEENVWGEESKETLIEEEEKTNNEANDAADATETKGMLL